MDRQIFILKYAAQDKSAYVTGILSCHASLRGAANELADTMSDLLSKGWLRLDRGLTVDSLRLTQPDALKMSLYSASFRNQELGRTMQLYVENSPLKN